jgi:hypothetical protein
MKVTKMTNKASVNIKKIVGYLIIIILSLNVSNAKIRFMPKDELISVADYIVVAKIETVTATDKIKHWRGVSARVVKNELEVIEIIKGSLPVGKPFIVNTLKFDEWMEDNIKLPRLGSNVLLFLKKNEKGELKPVNGIQGVWYMKDGLFTRLGSDTTLHKIREMVHKPVDICLSKKFLSLLDTAEIQMQVGNYKEALEKFRKAYGICPMKDLEEIMA